MDLRRSRQKESHAGGAPFPQEDVMEWPLRPRKKRVRLPHRTAKRTQGFIYGPRWYLNTPHGRLKKYADHWDLDMLAMRLLLLMKPGG